MNNLYYFRSISGIQPVVLSKLLNVTVHTYIAYEQEKMDAPFEIMKMLSLIYCVNIRSLSLPENLIPKETIKKVEQLSMLSDDDRIACCTENLLGKGCKLNYRNVRSKKEEIKKNR